MMILRNVRAGYDGTEILHGICASVEKGKNLSIIGPNGCGKTTLLRTIAGTLPYTGNIICDGIDIKEMKQKTLAKKAAMLSQINQMYFNYTVLETVLMGRFIYEQKGIFGGLSETDRREAKKALELVGMQDAVDREVDTLSGGQKQRVFLAKILAQNPDIILLDEPTNHLDFKYQIELIRFLRQWSAVEGKTVIGVLHDINLAMELSDEILLMNQGEIKAMGNVEEVYSSPMLSEVYGMDVAEYMLETLKKWEKMKK